MPTPTTASPATAIRAVVFDLGGVLIDWNPRHLYRHLFAGDERAMEHFLAEICTPAWNERQDAGRSWQAAIDEAVADHPQYEAPIRAYRQRWEEMLGGALDEGVAVLADLRRQPVRLFALTNWAADTFELARGRFPFLDWFEQIVVSGREGLAKPDPAIYALLLERCGLEAGSTLFIDDSPRNVEAARQLGWQALVYRNAAELRRELAVLGLPTSGCAA